MSFMLLKKYMYLSRVKGHISLLENWLKGHTWLVEGGFIRNLCPMIVNL